MKSIYGIVVAGLAAALAVGLGCKSGGGGTAAGGGTSTGVTGTWSGNVSLTIAPGSCQSGDPNDACTPLTLALTQSGSSVSGTVSCAPDPGSAPISGSISGSTLGVSVSNTCSGTPGGAATITFTGTVSGNTMSLTVGGTDCSVCTAGGGNEEAAGISGSGTLTKQ